MELQYAEMAFYRILSFFGGFLSGSLIVGGLVERLFLGNWGNGGPVVTIVFGGLIGLITILLPLLNDSI